MNEYPYLSAEKKKIAVKDHYGKHHKINKKY